MGSVSGKLRNRKICYYDSSDEEEDSLEKPLKKKKAKTRQNDSEGKETFKNLKSFLTRCSQIEDVGSAELADILETLDSFCEIPRESSDNLRQKWVQELTSFGFVNLWAKWWPEFWARDFTEKANVDLAQIKMNFTYGLRIIWNGSEISPDMCKQFSQAGCIKNLLEKLREKFSVEAAIKSSPNKRYIASGFLSIIQNCLRHYHPAKNTFRKNKGLEIAHQFSTFEFVNLKTKAVIILAYTVREHEMHMMTTTDEHIQYILSILKRAISSPHHRYKNFSVEELMAALNKIAANDSNKLKIVQKGALPIYVKLMRDGHSDLEICTAARGLWGLAFPEENKEKLMTEPECISTLEQLKLHTNRQISQAAEGALWLISLAFAKFRLRKKSSSVLPPLPAPDKKASDSSLSSRKSSVSPESTGHIMLSYSWDYKPTVQKFKAGLQASAGYKIWIDDDEMTGSLLQGMASAIEKASLVIIFVSESYKDSPSCRTEAEYIFRLQKSIIPIMNQAEYSPDGWLGALVGSQLHFVCTGIDQVDDLLPKVVKEVEQKLCNLNNNNASGHKISVVENSADPRFTDWSEETVIRWLSRTLALPPDVTSRFSGFDGQRLGALHRMYKKAPASFYNTLTQQFDMKLVDLLTLSNGLEKLK